MKNGFCRDCGVKLTIHNSTIYSKKPAIRTRCNECQEKHIKTCLCCGVILTVDNTYKGGPYKHSYCKDHSSVTGQAKYIRAKLAEEREQEQDANTKTQ
jgi:hypothetical protein